MARRGGDVARQGESKLDWDYIDAQLAPLAQAKEQPELLDQLQTIRARAKSID